MEALGGLGEFLSAVGMLLIGCEVLRGVSVRSEKGKTESWFSKVRGGLLRSWIQADEDLLLAVAHGEGGGGEEPVVGGELDRVAAG